ncbi:MAG: MBL fold metallo-hydrolase [bacterium]|nr:MBL fold metallo-hydrolase [bacterium]
MNSSDENRMKKFFIFLPLIIIAVLFVANVFIWLSALRGENGALTVSFLNVGQGDAVFIQAPNGRQALVDAGGTGAVLRELGGVLPFYDRSIDVVIATHPDTDHIGGFPEVFRRFNIGLILESGVGAETGVYETYNELAEKEAPRLTARRGMKIVLDKETYLTVLFPDRDLSSGGSANDASVITRLTHGETSFLLTGDASKAIEDYVTALSPQSVDVDVLKAGHHGSRTSSSETFVGFASPLFAVISAGENNRYGHPHDEVVSIFEKFGIPILGTYDKGRITFTSDGNKIKLKK